MLNYQLQPHEQHHGNSVNQQQRMVSKVALTLCTTTHSYFHSLGDRHIVSGGAGSARELSTLANTHLLAALMVKKVIVRRAAKNV